MRDHNETDEVTPHREHPNPSPWGDAIDDDDEGQPCDAPPAAWPSAA